MTEGERLAQFSELVRESSLKRFKQVAFEDRGLSVSPTQLNFIDILKHLVDADKWVIAILKDDKTIPTASVKVGYGSPEEWDKCLSDLERLGKEKAELLRKMSDDDFSREIINGEIMGKSNKWLVLMRGNLDHEIHHRGSLQIMLNLKYGPK